MRIIRNDVWSNTIKPSYTFFTLKKDVSNEVFENNILKGRNFERLHIYLMWAWAMYFKINYHPYYPIERIIFFVRGNLRNVRLRSVFGSCRKDDFKIWNEEHRKFFPVTRLTRTLEIMVYTTEVNYRLNKDDSLVLHYATFFAHNINCDM